MCIEDLRLGRKKYTSFRQVTVDVGGVQLLPFSENRTHISIHTFSASNVQVAPTGDAATFNSDGTFTVLRANPPLEFDVETHGDIVIKQWMASAAAPVDVAVIETFLADK